MPTKIASAVRKTFEPGFVSQYSTVRCIPPSSSYLSGSDVLREFSHIHLTKKNVPKINNVIYVTSFVAHDKASPAAARKSQPGFLFSKYLKSPTTIISVSPAM
ncbi:MAG: hypothetical protein BWY84_00833 [Candidatus Aerophobetes bacterium ADurb.Bin490]|nr:MAG: hypothetical protein BWY84_00833 [Candidatus Aerophobetes bacterium ADurb.Bin490]